MPLNIQKSYFSSRAEKYQLLLPLIVVPFVVIDLLFWQASKLNFFYAIVTFAGIHHLHSIQILIAKKEVRAEIIKKLHLKNDLIASLAVFALFGVFFYLILMASLKVNDRANFPIFLWIFFLLDTFFFTTFHMMKQSFGLSRMYDKLHGDDAEEIVTYKKREIGLFNYFIFFTVITSFFYHPARGYFLGTDKKGIEILDQLGIVLFVVTMLMGIYLFFNSYRQSKVINNSNKFIFAIRYLYWPFYSLSMVARGLLNILHAFEYYLTWDKLDQNKSNRVHFLKFSPMYLMFVFYMAVIFFGRNSLAVYWGLVDSKWLWHFAISIYGGMRLLHVVIDSVIFRSRFQMVRKNIINNLIHVEK